MTTITLAKIGNHQTVSYAVDELARYLKLMDKSLLVDQRTYLAYDASVENVVWVGLTPMVEYNKLDDEILIDVKDGVGTISGASERAVLIAAYRFLRELGCRWIRPGDDGEVIPEKKLDKAALNVNVHETPDRRYRVIAIEGASMYEHIYNMINWIPKVGMNAYYTQHLSPASFYRCWYGHKYNPFREAEDIEFDSITHSSTRIDEEIDKRSLGHLAVGHGWLLYPYDIYDKRNYTLPPEMVEDMALISGKRGIFGAQVGIDGNSGNIGFTQFCYSKKSVRDKVVEWAVEYCRNNPSVTFIRFILADGMNNWCECEECRKMRPADWYMMLLNDLDEALTAAGLDTKVSFVIYVDLLWAPTQIKLKNPDRFIMNLSPSSRTYSRPLYDTKVNPDDIELPEFNLNNNTFPRDVESIIAHFNAWRRWNPDCKCVIFDYHLMWDHYLDPGYASCARLLHKDVTGLDRFGFSGFISCQEQRAAFPTGLPMYAMAAGLWNKNSKFEDVSREYYEAAFGEDGPAVEAYLEKISELFDPAFMRNDHVEAHHNCIERMDAIDALVNEFETKYIYPNREKSAQWKYLSYHSTYCKMYAELVRTYAHGDQAKIDAQTRALTAYHFALEPETHAVHDNFFFDEVYQRWIKRVFSNKPVEVDF